jgi:hypothetical protein
MIELSKHNSIIEPDDTLITYHTFGLSDCRAVPLMLRVYADMIDSGHNGDYSVHFNNDHEIVWAEYNGKPIGGIYYIVRNNREIAWNTFVFVDNKWRSYRILPYCYEGLVSILLERNIKELHAYINVTNTRGIEFSRSVGFTTHPSKFSNVYLIKKILSK